MVETRKYQDDVAQRVHLLKQASAYATKVQKNVPSHIIPLGLQMLTYIRRDDYGMQRSAHDGARAYAVGVICVHALTIMTPCFVVHPCKTR